MSRCPDPDREDAVEGDAFGNGVDAIESALSIGRHPSAGRLSHKSDDVIISFSPGEKVRLRGNDATVILVPSNG